MSGDERAPGARASGLASRLARLRVPLGFAFVGVCLWAARPTPRSIAIGMAVAAAGEALRVWAAGHIEKGREITRSGPYRFVRHPLYLGSSIMTAGFVFAANSVVVFALAAVYLAATIGAAIRTEERVLDERFDGAYSAYRAGRAPSAARSFSVARARRNREHRAVAGLLLVSVLLYVRYRLSTGQ